MINLTLHVLVASNRSRRATLRDQARGTEIKLLAQAAVPVQTEAEEEQAMIAALREETERQYAAEFHVIDRTAADWLVAQQTRRKDELKRVKGQFDRIIKQLQKEIDFFSEYRIDELEAWARAELAGGKKKSIKLPHGDIGFRWSDWRIEIEDMDAAVAAAEVAVPDAIKIKKTVTLTELKEHLDETGELLTGCKFIPASDKFYVK